MSDRLFDEVTRARLLLILPFAFACEQSPVDPGTPDLVEGAIAFTPESCDFGVVDIGSDASCSVDVANVGTVAVNVVFDVEPSEVFSVDTERLELATDESTTIQVRATPQTVGSATGNLDGGLASIPLAVTGQCLPVVSVARVGQSEVFFGEAGFFRAENEQTSCGEHEIAEYRWSVLAPEDLTQVELFPNGPDSSVAAAGFPAARPLDVAVELTVIDGLGASSLPVAAGTVRFNAELVLEVGSAFEPHLFLEGTACDPEYDCFAASCALTSGPSWDGTSGKSLGDPIQDATDAAAFAWVPSPEREVGTIILAGVYARSTTTPATATASLSMRDRIEVFERLLEPGDFWVLARTEWFNEPTVTRIDVAAPRPSCP